MFLLLQLGFFFKHTFWSMIEGQKHNMQLNPDFLDFFLNQFLNAVSTEM